MARTRQILAVLALSGVAATASAPAPAEAAPCDGKYFSEVHQQGAGLGFLYSGTPTFRSRVGPNTRTVHGEMWAEMQRCGGPIPPDVPEDRRISMLQQLACHAEFAWTEGLGGPTWDVEADQRALPAGKEFEVLEHECNWDHQDPNY